MERRSTCPRPRASSPRASAAGELARPRGRRGRRSSGSRRSTRELNAFVEVDAERRARRRPTRSSRGDERAVRRRPDRDQGQRAGRRAVHELRLALPRRPPARRTAPTSCGGCATPGFVIVGTTNLPEFGILPTTEPRHTGPTRNPWDLDAHAGRLVRRRRRRRSRPGMRAGRARQRRRRLAAHPRRLLRARRPQAEPRARSRAGPTSATRSSPADGVLTRTVAETALLLDVLAGYEVGDATWAPRPAEPYATADAPRPGPAAGRDDRRQRARRRRRPGVRARRCTRPPSCCAALGHEVVEASPGAARPGRRSSCSSHVFGPAVALGDRLRRAARRARRRRRTRSSRCRARCCERAQRAAGHRATSPRSRSCRRSRAASSRSSPTTTCC